MTPIEKMQAIYDMEINCQINSFWDGGFYVTFGDHINGWKTQEENFETYQEAVDWIYEQALKRKK